MFIAAPQTYSLLSILGFIPFELLLACFYLLLKHAALIIDFGKAASAGKSLCGFIVSFYLLSQLLLDLSVLVGLIPIVAIRDVFLASVVIALPFPSTITKL